MNNFQKEMDNIELVRKVKINIYEDSTLNNSEIVFETHLDKKNKKKSIKKKSTKKENISTTRKKVTKEKEKNEKIIKTKSKTSKSALKEIKNKKTGWWQK